MYLSDIDSLLVTANQCSFKQFGFNLPTMLPSFTNKDGAQLNVMILLVISNCLQPKSFTYVCNHRENYMVILHNNVSIFKKQNSNSLSCHMNAKLSAV